MAILKKKYFSWAEPWFYVLRERSAREWMILLALCVVISAVITAVCGLAFGPQWEKLLTLFLGGSLVLWYIIDGNNLFRSVSIDEKEITIIGEGGYQHASVIGLPILQINSIVLARASDLNKPLGSMMVEAGQQTHVVAVPKVIDMDRLAQTLHTLGASVHLNGWEPTSEPIRVVAEALISNSNADANATITNIEAIEPRLVTTGDRVVAGLMAGWPLLLSILLFLGCIGYAIWNWSAISVLEAILWIGAPIVIGFLSLVIVSRYANFIETGYLIRKGANGVSARSKVIIPEVGNCLAIMHIDRAQWTNLMPSSSDFGFFTADIKNQRFLFEGNKHRWEIPLDSIQICQLEHVDVGAQTDSGKQAKRWMVNLTIKTSEGPKELGVRRSNDYVGAENDQMRERLAVELFDYIAVTMDRMRQ